MRNDRIHPAASFLTLYFTWACLATCAASGSISSARADVIAVAVPALLWLGMLAVCARALVAAMIVPAIIGGAGIVLLGRAFVVAASTGNLSRIGGYELVGGGIVFTLLVLVPLLLGVLAFRWSRMATRPPAAWQAPIAPSCPRCGYDLQGTRVVACPECGAWLGTRRHD